MKNTDVTNFIDDLLDLQNQAKNLGFNKVVATLNACFIQVGYELADKTKPNSLQTPLPPAPPPIVKKTMGVDF